MSDHIHDLFGLQGRVAVVTGGSGLIGSAISRGLAQAGARVAILSRKSDACAAVATSINNEGCEAIATPADVLQRDHLVAARDRILQQWGAIDILVNVAGGAVPGSVIPAGSSLFELSMDATRQVVDLNLHGTLLPILTFGEVLASRLSGAIVNISSMAAQHVSQGFAGYSAAKAGVEQLTRWLAVELGFRYDGRVRVNAIAPSFTIGERNRGRYFNEDGTLTEVSRGIVSGTPLGRLGLPEDLVGTAVWLCGAGAAFVTGMVIKVDGGRYLGTDLRRGAD